MRKGDLADPKRLQQKVNEAKAARAREADEVAGGGVQGEELRQSLASAFLKDALRRRSTIDGVVDGKMSLQKSLMI